MRQELVELIQRMTAREKVSSSDNSISWHAHREAELLADEALIGELNAYLHQKPKKEQRSAAYFIIGKIGKNSLSEECASSLIEHASKETDKYALANLLDRLADVPKLGRIDVRPLFPHLKDERWLVRHAAIRSLKWCQSTEAEDILLEILATTANPYDVLYCHTTLSQIGTGKALPVLAQSLKSRKRDVKISAEAAIKAIEMRQGRPALDTEEGSPSGRC